uniref:Uncharacterized protein n=1 Tax=Cacopsylla melanoneura TaxID=428564 RepID=A0A8D8RMA9_9HEMI
MISSSLLPPGGGHVSSNCIKFASRSLSLDFKSLPSPPEGEEGSAGSSSSGLGCIRVNGSSATRSPPRAPRQSFTLTLYCTMIPRLSRARGSLIMVDEARFVSSSLS